MTLIMTGDGDATTVVADWYRSHLLRAEEIVLAIALSVVGLAGCVLLGVAGWEGTFSIAKPLCPLPNAKTGYPVSVAIVWVTFYWPCTTHPNVNVSAMVAA